MCPTTLDGFSPVHSPVAFKSNYIVRGEQTGVWGASERRGLAWPPVTMRTHCRRPSEDSHSHLCITPVIMLRQHIWGWLACYIRSNELIYKQYRTQSPEFYPLGSFSFFLQMQKQLLSVQDFLQVTGWHSCREVVREKRRLCSPVSPGLGLGLGLIHTENFRSLNKEMAPASSLVAPTHSGPWEETQAVRKWAFHMQWWDCSFR